jgi:hypothetical protein
VNYAKKGTKHEDKIKVIQILEIDEQKGIVKENSREYDRIGFAEWFRKLNKESCA